ncbi:MAG: DNA polymerase I [Paludibacteraceae bacterium]|nr:DNA polymerase I [Paludibacteraceae bacterium]
MKKLFLLDAYALIYRAYFAFIKAPRINSKGLNTSAILGFVNTLEDVLKREQPTHIGVAFDPSGPTFRHEAYDAYKAGREQTPEDIRLSVPIIKEVLNAYRIPIFEVKGFEADDVIGTMAKQAATKGFEVFMLTPDKDYGQLVDEHIFMYRPRHNGGYEVMGVAEVTAKYGLKDQLQVIDLLGLMGDSSDNIPGCPGVGEKTAVKLLQEFGSIDYLLGNTHLLKGALKTKIENNIDQIKFSQFLATIKTDVPLVFDENAMLRQQPDTEALRTIFSELEFRSLLRNQKGELIKEKGEISGNRLIGESMNSGIDESTKRLNDSTTKQTNHRITKDDGMMDLFAGLDNDESECPESSKQLNESTTKHQVTASSEHSNIHTTAHNYQLITEEQLPQWAEVLKAQSAFCFDTETTGLQVMSDKLVGLSFAWKAHEAYYIPVNEQNSKNILSYLRPAFENENTLKIGQNCKFDLLLLKRYGIEVNGPLFDTMLAHYLLQPELRHGMDYLAEIYLHYQTIAYDDLVGGKGKNKKSIDQIPIEQVAEYAAEDADITLQLKEILAKELQQAGMEKLFYELEMPLLRTLVNMEMAGVRIDSNALKASSQHLHEQLSAIEQEVYALSGCTFNISSAKQVGEVLFDRLKIVDKAKKTKTGQYITSEEVLEGLRHKHPVVGKILDYRGIKKLLSTYIEALPLLVNPTTGKIHTSYNQAVTATGRLSSSNPNLQNIPVRDDMGKEIRKCFIADEGCLFFSADYSQIELRIMAHLSGDSAMIEAFNMDGDIHAATAAKIYKVPIDQVTADMRRKAKTANFGIIYGISVFGLSERLQIQRSEAKQLIDGYFETYPQIKTYMDNCIEQARQVGYVQTLWGRKRYLPDINSGNSFVRGFAERNAINAPIQGSAADIIKVAMIAIDQAFKKSNLKSQMILQVHDELNFNVYPDELEQVKQIVCHEMQQAIKLNVPLIADCGIGTNWLEAH